jgi:hypothetical protein
MLKSLKSLWNKILKILGIVKNAEEEIEKEIKNEDETDANS